MVLSKIGEKITAQKIALLNVVTKSFMTIHDNIRLFVSNW